MRIDPQKTFYKEKSKMNNFNNNYYTPPSVQPPNVDLKKAKYTYSIIGFSLCAIIVVVYILSTILSETLSEDSWFLTSPWGFWIINYLPVYGIAIPIGIFFMTLAPSSPPEKRGMEGKAFFFALCIMFFFTSVGNIVGNMLAAYLSNGTAENAVAELAMSTNPLKIVVMVILAPIIEEYVFRKQIIDRTVRYGEKTAVLFSGLLFGLFHTNLFQFFYAFLGGALFAYIYVRSGRLRYPILLHAIINFNGAVIAPYFLSKMSEFQKLHELDPMTQEAEINELVTKLMPISTLLMVYYVVFFGLAITGLVMYILHRKRVRWQPAKEQLPHTAIANTVYMNAGIITFVTVTTALTIISLFS